jgi:hypothetical protein
VPDGEMLPYHTCVDDQEISNRLSWTGSGPTEIHNDRLVCRLPQDGTMHCALEHLFYKLGKKDYLGALFTAAPKSTPYVEVWSSATDGHTAESVYKERDAPAGLFSSLRHRGGPRGATNNSAKVARENL